MRLLIGLILNLIEMELLIMFLICISRFKIVFNKICQKSYQSEILLEFEDFDFS